MSLMLFSSKRSSVGPPYILKDFQKPQDVGMIRRLLDQFPSTKMSRHLNQGFLNTKNLAGPEISDIYIYIHIWLRVG